MEVKQKLDRLLLSQKKLLQEYESAVKEFESNDTMAQNSELKKEVERCKKLLEEIAQKYDVARQENQRLKIALKEQIVDEKLNILKVSKEKLDTYFGDTSKEYNNRLNAVEKDAREKLHRLKKIASAELEKEKGSFFLTIGKMEVELQNKIRDLKARFEGAKEEVSQDVKSRMGELEEEGVSEEVIRRRTRQNNIEIKIGLSWINKIGIFLILIGVATALKYTYSNYFNNEMRGIFAFLIGGLFLGGGEWFSQKEKNIFAQGLTGGGIGILYLAVFSSFFALEIISLGMALIISVLITATALVFSIRYNSRTICSFALVGGFFPFFSYVFAFGLSLRSIYIAMGYLFILNLLTLLLSQHKKWDIVNYISFLLNVPTLIYLVFKIPSPVVASLYSILTFTMYLVITLAYPYKHKLKLKAMDVTLLVLNTLVSCVTVFALFEKAGLDQWRGALALAFCLLYFGLGQWLHRYMRDEKSTRVLFYLTAYAFAVLTVPFQLGIKWFALGWLVESMMMVLYGYKHRIKYLEIGGWFIFGLCFSSVLTIDFIRYEILVAKDAMPHFHFRYFAITAGLLYNVFMYLFDMKKDVILKHSLRGKLATGLKYLAILNLWAYLIYASRSFYQRIIVYHGMVETYYHLFFKMILFAFVTIGLAYAISKIPVLYDRVVRYFAMVLYCIAAITCALANFFMPVFEPHYDTVKYVAVTLLMLFNIYTFLSIRDLLISHIRKEGINVELYPLIMALYFLATVTAVLTVQFNLGEMNLLFSVVYLATALGCILYGFLRKYTYTRRFGLGLTIFSTAKLFIYDLAYLDTVGKIVAYFIFGLVLIGISFAYQRLSQFMKESN